MSCAALRHVSLVALTCVLCITVMIILFAFDLGGNLDPCPEEGAASISCPPGPVTLVTTPLATLKALPLFVFSYTCHQNIFSITNELHNPTVPPDTAGRFQPRAHAHHALPPRAAAACSWRQRGVGMGAPII